MSVTRRNWTRSENEATVDAYFEMLTAELRGIPIVKARRNRLLIEALDHRTRGALEFKHENISAILLESGRQYVSGYKPRHNYQEDLREVVLDKLEAHPDLAHLLEADTQVVVEPRISGNILEIETDAPASRDTPRRVADRAARRTSRQVDYLEIEARNSALGLKGEMLAVDFEHARLRHLGRPDLADRIEHTARTVGDGYGYDIASFERDGQPRLIEVKTTKYGEYTPFYLSRGELRVSQENEAIYHLYRMFNFRESPRLFILRGCIATNCEIAPTSYVASLR